MKALHAICGLPRSGSTLLCNVLAQNPDFFASSTSCLSGSVGGLSMFWSTTEEIKADLAHDKERTEERLERVLKAVIEAWYADREEEVVFDKSRDWISQADTMARLFPDTMLICCIRDPREVFASIVRQSQRFPLLNNVVKETMFAKADRMFAADNIIGGPIVHIEDSLRRRHKNVVPFAYEPFVEDPERELRKLYAELKIDWWSGHDLENVEDVSTDLDALTLYEFPHEGSGKVEKKQTTWQDVLSPDIAKSITDTYPGFCQAFGYR